jgi:hypothetical protein
MKSAFVSIGANAAFTAIAASAPWVRLPVIRHVTEYILKRIISFVVNSGETGAFFLYIDIRVNQQASEFEFAAHQNKRAQENGTQEQKDAAEKLLVEKFTNFVRLSS